MSTVVAWLNTHGTTLVWLAVVLVGVAVLHKVAKLLRAAGEAARLVVWVVKVPFLGAWWAGKGLWWLGRQARRFWRTSLGLVGAGGLVLLVGAPSAGVVATVALVAGIAAWCWWFAWRESFTRLVGMPARGWWRHWAVYAPRWGRWMRRLGLVVKDVISETSEGVQTVAAVAVPRLVRVHSDPWWDTLHVALAVGQAPEDVTAKISHLRTALRSDRVLVREPAPGVVDIAVQRRDLLATTIPALPIPDVAGDQVDLKAATIGRTEFGEPFTVPLLGGHLLGAGETGGGKSSLLWCPIRAVAPAVRDGLVRLWGVDPKVLEMAMCRPIFHRLGTGPIDAHAILLELLDLLEQRKRELAGAARQVTITPDTPLELLFLDEIGALLKYLGTRQQQAVLAQLLALVQTQGRALGFGVAAFVQDPSKDTVPVRDLFPNRVCLRVRTSSQVDMVLGEGMRDLGALADRIPHHLPGVGYVRSEDQKEALRVRAGHVTDGDLADLVSVVCPDGQSLNAPIPEKYLAAARGDGDGGGGAGRPKLRPVA
ncbi:FtsK/SpoIIIE domain-containing protein [Streptoalloteichus hindustanus]|uniref:FtsK/SpoIIIE domain-containing protein n=1 Tax=Streptoalloteichus hindustanus TaxID=2017 RepID=UPI0011613453|nr:FtsK/SpoIIIE domain-containing protein [Streptoalloteichus hindustanus]